MQSPGTPLTRAFAAVVPVAALRDGLGLAGALGGDARASHAEISAATPLKTSGLVLASASLGWNGPRGPSFGQVTCPPTCE